MGTQYVVHDGHKNMVSMFHRVSWINIWFQCNVSWIKYGFNVVSWIKYDLFTLNNVCQLDKIWLTFNVVSWIKYISFNVVS